jgi:DNA-binding transcriptional MocR family regulator
VDPKPRLYGGERVNPRLLEIGARLLKDDAIPADALTVVGGALDGIERVLGAHLRAGDRVAVEDPGYTGVLDLVSGLGLVPEPVEIDDFGPKPEALKAALDRGVQAAIVTPRAQNPTGAALDPKRGKDLKTVLDGHENVLVIEDDHAGPVAGTKAVTLAHRQRERWAVVRSVSKSLGPDLRLAFLAGDATTVARVEGRQHVGSGWVSHVLQQLTLALLEDAKTKRLLDEAERAYTERREGMLAALKAHGIEAHGRSGMNVWVPVSEEQAVVAGMAAAGWAVRAGERYRLRSPAAIRITTAALKPDTAKKVASDLTAILTNARRTRSV